MSSEVKLLAADEPLTFIEALECCKSLNMSLPVVRDLTFNKKLAVRARQQMIINRDQSWNRIWLAANRLNSLDMYQGDSEEPVIFTNFDSHNEASIEANCVEMYLRAENTFNGNWATDHCVEKKRFFCMSS